jgi:hypothetical protein
MLGICQWHVAACVSAGCVPPQWCQGDSHTRGSLQDRRPCGIPTGLAGPLRNVLRWALHRNALLCVMCYVSLLLQVVRSSLSAMVLHMHGTVSALSANTCATMISSVSQHTEFLNGRLAAALACSWQMPNENAE